MLEDVELLRLALLKPDALMDDEEVDLPLVLVAVLRLELEDGVADVLELKLLPDESVLVLVDLNTPLV